MPSCRQCCRLLIEALPPLETIPAHALAELTELHLQSSADLLQTIKLIAPQAFSSDAAVPDLSTLGAAHSSLMGLLSNVTDLQVFHMRRAVAINAEMRARINARQHLQQQASMHGSFSSSSCSDSSQTLQQQLQLLLQRQQSPQPLLHLSIDQQVLQQQAPQLELQLSVDQQVLQLQGMIPQCPQDQALPLITSCQQQPEQEAHGLTVQQRTPSPTAQAQISMQLAQPSSTEGHPQDKAQQLADACQQAQAQHRQQQAQAQSGEPQQLPSEQLKMFNQSVALSEASRPETQLEHDQGQGQQACLRQPQCKPKHHPAAQLQQAKEQVQLLQLQPTPRPQPNAQVQQAQGQLVLPQGQIRQRRLKVSLAPQIQFEAHLAAIQCHMQQLGLQAKQSQPHIPVSRQNSRQQLLLQKLEQKLQRVEQPEQQ